MDPSDYVPKLVETKVCESCGTQIWVYDPPIVFDIQDGCDARNSRTGRTCYLIKGHSGRHHALVEEVESWE